MNKINKLLHPLLEVGELEPFTPLYLQGED